VRQFTKAARTLPSCCQDLTQGVCTSHILPPFAERKRPDREVIENMPHDGHNPHNDALRALYALLAGAEGCGPAARSARLARDDELADFLCGAHEGIVGEARRLLAQRVAE
jgi:hypothetical protein